VINVLVLPPRRSLTVSYQVRTALHSFFRRSLLLGEAIPASTLCRSGVLLSQPYLRCRRYRVLLYSRPFMAARI